MCERRCTRRRCERKVRDTSYCYPSSLCVRKQVYSCCVRVQTQQSLFPAEELYGMPIPESMKEDALRPDAADAAKDTSAPRGTLPDDDVRKKTHGTLQEVRPLPPPPTPPTQPNPRPGSHPCLLFPVAGASGGRPWRFAGTHPPEFAAAARRAFDLRARQVDSTQDRLGHPPRDPLSAP